MTLVVCSGSMSATNNACLVSRVKGQHIDQLFHTTTLGSLAVSSESSVGVSVESDLEAALALGTSNSNDKLECSRLCRAAVHKDVTPCVPVSKDTNISLRGQRASRKPKTMSAPNGTETKVSDTVR